MSSEARKGRTPESPWRGLRRPAFLGSRTHCRSLGLALGAAVVALLPSTPAGAASCEPLDEPATLSEVVGRVDAGEVRYLFVGERHGVGPVKRFAVDLVNALVARGHEVGFYVEGFRTDCAPEDGTCRSLARWFNPLAFDTLLLESRAAVHAIDPPQRASRGALMAEAIAAGSEAVRVVLIGESHVRHAGDEDAEWPVFGGAVLFPDPGDVAEAFPRHEVVTIGLETGHGFGPRSVRAHGCGVDYLLTTADSVDYWAGSEEEIEIPGPAPAFDLEATPSALASERADSILHERQ